MGVIRSALVLHTISVLLIAIAVVVNSFLWSLVLTWWDEPGTPFFAMDYHHLSRGAYFVGFLGFCTMGFEGFMAPIIWGGDLGRGRPFGAMGFMVVLGLINAVVFVYNHIKLYTAKLLQSAEAMVLEVGDGDFDLAAAAPDG